MQCLKLNVVCRQSTHTISTNQQQVSLLQNIAYQHIKDQAIIQFYQNHHFPKSDHIINPIQTIKHQQQLIFIYNSYGKAVSAMSEYEYGSLIKQQFLKQILSLHMRYEYLLPQILLSNIFYLRFFPIKLLIQKKCRSIDDFINNFKTIISIIFKIDETIIKKSSAITNMEEIIKWNSQFCAMKEGKTISQLIQLKNNSIKIVGPKIELSEEQWKWVFTSAGYENIPKYEQIYNAIHSNFDPAHLLKTITKLLVFYLLQNTKGDKVVFFPAIKPQISSNTMFGVYYPDKQKKSLILGINKRSIHKLKDSNYAVGYGSQMLLAIGKLDILLSPFNISNVSYFPISYEVDKEKGVQTAKDLLGEQFQLKQLQVFKILQK